MAKQNDWAEQGPNASAAGFRRGESPKNETGANETGAGETQNGASGAADADESACDDLSYTQGSLYTFRPKKSKSGLQIMLELLTGGLAGTLVAYYGLAWYQGSAFVLPKFGLPGIEKLTAAPPKSGNAGKKGDAKTGEGKAGGTDKSKRPGETPPKSPATTPISTQK